MSDRDRNEDGFGGCAAGSYAGRRARTVTKPAESDRDRNEEGFGGCAASDAGLRARPATKPAESDRDRSEEGFGGCAASDAGLRARTVTKPAESDRVRNEEGFGGCAASDVRAQRPARKLQRVRCQVRWPRWTELIDPNQLPFGRNDDDPSSRISTAAFLIGVAPI
ncbi:hypothetical protein BH11MYX1_BH11MYX1_10920 [soil metagenome]